MAEEELNDDNKYMQSHKEDDSVEMKEDQDNNIEIMSNDTNVQEKAEVATNRENIDECNLPPIENDVEKNGECGSESKHDASVRKASSKSNRDETIAKSTKFYKNEVIANHELDFNNHAKIDTRSNDDITNTLQQKDNKETSSYNEAQDKDSQEESKASNAEQKTKSIKNANKFPGEVRRKRDSVRCLNEESRNYMKDQRNARSEDKKTQNSHRAIEHKITQPLPKYKKAGRNKASERYDSSQTKTKGYEYWRKVVRRWHVPAKDEWKIIELEILKMKLQKDPKPKFNFIKLNKLIK
eukprot:TRINITY_DN9758_c0_g1_i17.p1 TRINITY_DN9758_c0_g1~~TRINITY_DN9758_c0_g1_i17.p1  ORF type:complete len:345 (-),score=75.90 TRINITY_DN9758_c0_g1_i17:210-1100(-)